MAKYTNLQLHIMAIKVNDDLANGGDKSFRFVMQLSALTGVSPKDIQNRINYYATMEI